MNPFVSLWSRKRILRKGRLTGCLILIALVVSVLVIALVFSESMMDGVLNKYILLSSGHISVDGVKSEDLLLDESYIADIQNTFYGAALLYSDTSTSSLALKGVEPDYFDGLRSKEIEITKTDNETSLHGIIISQKTASALKVNLGDRIALFVVKNGKNSVLRPTILFIEGIYTTGYDSMDKNVAFIDFDYCCLLFDDESAITTEIILNEESENNIYSIIKEINQINGVTASSWLKENSSIYNNFITTKQSIMLVLILIVVVASYYSVSTAQQIVSDDIREIAISKLLGATDKQVRNSAFISVFSVILIGIFSGFCFGIIFSFLIKPVLKLLSDMSFDLFSYYLLDFEIKIPFKSILIVMFVMIVLSSVTIFISLRKTRKISPIQLFTTV